MILEILHDKLEFTININMTNMFHRYYGNSNKEFSVSEDIIKKNDLKFNKTDSQEMRTNLKDIISDIMLNQVTPIIESVLINFDGYTIYKQHSSTSSATKGEDEISFAYYYDLTKDIKFTNISKQLSKALSLIIIRFSNHINKQERRDLKKLTIPQKMHIKLPPLTKEFVETCVFNIIELHADMLEHIENHPEIEFDTIESLGQKYVNKLKELQIQGDFSDQF